MKRLHQAVTVPRHAWLRHVVHGLETDPRKQFTVHKWGALYWLVNFPLVTALFFLEPALWLKLGIFITLIYSIYANFATDYGAMSAAMAAYGASRCRGSLTHRNRGRRPDRERPAAAH